MKLKEVKISYGIADMIRYYNEGVDEHIWPEEKIPIRESNYKGYNFKKDDTDLSEEENWFKEKIVKIFNECYIFLFYIYKEEELRKHMYAIYANECYKRHKEIPIDFVTFNKWLNEYAINRSTLLDGGTVFYTFREMHFGRKFLKFAYLELESVERLVDNNKSLDEQKELIDSIYACFNKRWYAESAIWNIVINNLDASAAEIAVNELFVKYEPNKTSALFNNTIHIFDHDESMNKRIMEEIKEDEEKIENEVEKEEDPVDTDIFKEIDSAYEYIKTMDDFFLKEKDVKEDVKAREFGKMYWKIRKHFLQKGIEYDPFLVSIENEDICLYCCGKGFDLKHKGDVLYRSTDEEIYNLDALLYEVEKEVSKNNEERIQRDNRAKEHFFQFLDNTNRKRFQEEQYVLLESGNNTYIIHELKSYNNILKICKKTGDKRALCIGPKNPKISEFDVYTTIVMLLQSGKEDYLLEIANEYPFLIEDEEIFQQLFTKEKIA